MTTNGDSNKYRWPAEWEEHAATWIAWPHNHNDWPDKFEPIPWVYAEIIRWLQRSERVHILVPSELVRQQAQRILAKCQVSPHRLSFHVIPTDRSWTRDYAPIFVKDNMDNKLALKWAFNGWAKYPDWQQDNQAGYEIARLSGTKLLEVIDKGKPVVLEGGAIDGNGAGIIMATEECLLSQEQERNPGFEREDYERLWTTWLGAKKIIWLAGGITGDDTHGHIDDVARFAGQDVVLLVRPSDRNHRDYDLYQENLHRLRSFTWEHKSWRIVELPMPEPRVFDGQPLPASYANFYIANDVVLVPLYHDPADRLALNIFADLFPDRQVVGIYCGDLILGLGALHCLAMQEPL